MEVISSIFGPNSSSGEKQRVADARYLQGIDGRIRIVYSCDLNKESSSEFLEGMTKGT